MDRTPPVAPDVGPAVRQIAGETLPNGVTTSLQSKVTLQDSTQRCIHCAERFRAAGQRY